MKSIPLKNGKSVMIDDHWFDYLNQWKWRITAGSVCRTEIVNGKQVVIHMRRVIMSPQGKQIVTHNNDNPLDCQEHNLTLTTRREIYIDRFQSSVYPCGND